jgi:hypothetical protein
MFKMNNDSIITFRSVSNAITVRGNGATGFKGSEAIGIQTIYLCLEDNKFNAILSNPPTKIRFYTSDRYIESLLKLENVKLFVNAIKLVKEAPPPK